MKKILNLALGMAFLCAIIYACQREGEQHKLSSTSTEHQNKILENLEKNLTESRISFRTKTSEEVKESEELGCRSGSGSSGVCLELQIKDTISLPAHGDRPACNSVQVTYGVRICRDFYTDAVEVTYSDFDAVELGCSDLTDYWFSLNNEELTVEEESFTYDASMIVESNFSFAVLKNSQTICPFQAIENNFYTPLCYQLCVNIHDKKAVTFIDREEKNTFRGDDPAIFRLFKRVPCGRRCCLRKRNVCIDGDGNIAFSDVTFQELGGSCGSSPIKPECTGTLVGKCEHSCHK